VRDDKKLSHRYRRPNPFSIKIEVPLLITLERVALLKSIDMFTGTPDYVLASVARIVEEVELAPGEILIEEGEPGDCLYIVIQGQVRVYSVDTTIINLGPGQSVGEFAILDPGPRAASVSAEESTLLFRIDKAPFDEVMADRPEIAHGIIRALIRRLREQGRIAPSTSGPSTH
jgi:CRP-like cAMP-binding protein